MWCYFNVTIYEHITGVDGFYLSLM